MKTITLPKTTAMPAAEILRTVLGSGGTNGIPLAQVRIRLKLIDKFEGNPGSVELEDAEYATVKAVFESHAFPQVVPDIVQVGDAIDGAV